MLKILSSGSEPDAALLRAMFAARKSVFVDLLGWDVPVLEDKYEIDKFDDVHARYLILANEGEHLASARLLPTMREGILSGLYPMLCTGTPPADPDVFEITRFCLDRRLSARERRAVRDALVAGLAAHALDAGIRAYCAVAATSWAQQIAAFGWDCRPLGPSCRLDGEDLIAMHIAITPATPALLARAGIAAPATLPVPGSRPVAGARRNAA